MEFPLSSVITFLIGLVISTIIIFIITKLFGEKEGIGRAFLAAIIGSVIYAIAYHLLGRGWTAAIIGGFVWLLALKGLYKMGWLKSIVVAVVIWIVATIVGFFLPTGPGPL